MSWLAEAWRIFEAASEPLSMRQLAFQTGMSEDEAVKCIVRLKADKCIKYVSGSARAGRYYQLVPGAARPESERGRHPNSLGALQGINARRRAARPVSQVTAARGKR